MSILGHDVKKLAALTGGATGAQPAFTFQLGPAVGGVVQVELTGTGSVTIEGRLGPDAPWASLNTAITTSSIVALARSAPQMRANVTANSATCNVWAKA